jgi:hypothetical protein
MMTAINRRKSRLRAVLLVALAMGAGSAALSGTLATLSGQSLEARLA